MMVKLNRVGKFCVEYFIAECLLKRPKNKCNANDQRWQAASPGRDRRVRRRVAPHQTIFAQM